MSLSSQSTLGGHLECDRSVSRERPEHTWATEWSQRGTIRDARLFAVPQLEQTVDYSPTGAGWLEGESAAELVTGRLLGQRQLGQDQSVLYQGGTGHDVRWKVGRQIEM